MRLGALVNCHVPIRCGSVCAATVISAQFKPNATAAREREHRFIVIDRGGCRELRNDHGGHRATAPGHGKSLRQSPEKNQSSALMRRKASFTAGRAITAPF